MRRVVGPLTRVSPGTWGVRVSEREFDEWVCDRELRRHLELPRGAGKIWLRRVSRRTAHSVELEVVGFQVRVDGGPEVDAHGVLFDWLDDLGGRAHVEVEYE